MLEFGSFLRAVNDRPYEWMTMGCLEFDGDCHTSVRYFIAMTGKSAPRYRTTERYRAAQGRNDYTYLAHDLAVGPADKFQIYLSAE